MSIIQPNLVSNKKGVLLTTAQYESSLHQLPIIPTSDFLKSTICFWNEENTCQFYAIDEALLLVQLNPPFGDAFANLLCEHANDYLIDSSFAIMKNLGIAKLRVTCFNQLEPDLVKYALEVEADEVEYIYALSDLAAMEGSKYKKQRNALSKVTRDFEAIEFNIYDLAAYAHKQELIDFCQESIAAKVNKEDAKAVNLNKELLAFNKCMQLSNQFNLQVAVLRIQGKISGILLFEAYNKEWLIGHFSKTINGIGVYLLHAFSSAMQAQQYRYFNFQEDRGVASLRYFKQQLNPALLLQSYQVISK